VIILKGVTVGHDSVIGAGAIVTRSVPPGSVVVGPAARVLKMLDLPSRAGVAGVAPPTARNPTGP
jgi:maltose O-acetyltransferase